MNDTDSPVQYREPRFCPFDGEPGSRQFSKAAKKKLNPLKGLTLVQIIL